MRVELVADGPVSRGIYNRGDRLDLPEDEALDLIAAGRAMPVGPASPERAVPRRRAQRAGGGS